MKSYNVNFRKEFSGVIDGSLIRALRKVRVHHRLPVIVSAGDVDNNQTQNVMGFINQELGAELVNAEYNKTENGVEIAGTLQPFGCNAVRFIELVKEHGEDLPVDLYGYWGNTDGKFVTVLGLQIKL